MKSKIVCMDDRGEDKKKLPGLTKNKHYDYEKSAWEYLGLIRIKDDTKQFNLYLARRFAFISY